MCNFGGSSTNTNQIIRGQRDPNRSRLSFARDWGDTALDGMGESVEKPKSKQKTKLTSSDNYQG